MLGRFEVNAAASPWRQRTIEHDVRQPHPERGGRTECWTGEAQESQAGLDKSVHQRWGFPGKRTFTVPPGEGYGMGYPGAPATI